MEELILRFSHLSEKVFNHLNNESIVRCININKLWHNYLKTQKFVEIRKIKATIQQFHSIGEEWSTVFDATSTKNIMELGLAVGEFYTKGADLTYHEG